MTRYEVYLNLYFAMMNYMYSHMDDDDLATFVNDMNPFCYKFEGSNDYYIYERFLTIWNQEGTMYTFNTENNGFSFSKLFMEKLPKTDKRFQAGLKAIKNMDDEDWMRANYWQATTGTYQLLYYLLNGLDNKSDELVKFLDGMNPFEEGLETYSKDPRISDIFFNMCEKYNPKEVSYILASKFIDKLNYPFLNHAFMRISEDKWDKVRNESPTVFRYIIE